MRKTTSSLLTQRALLFTFFLLSASSIALGQGFGSVRGTVKDPSGSVVPAATVTVKAMSSAWTQTTQTDATGNFTINAIPIGEYEVAVQREGFKTATQTVQIIIGSAPTV